MRSFNKTEYPTLDPAGEQVRVIGSPQTNEVTQDDSKFDLDTLALNYEKKQTGFVERSIGASALSQTPSELLED